MILIESTNMLLSFKAIPKMSFRLNLEIFFVYFLNFKIKTLNLRNSKPSSSTSGKTSDATKAMHSAKQTNFNIFTNTKYSLSLKQTKN